MYVVALSTITMQDFRYTKGKIKMNDKNPMGIVRPKDGRGRGVGGGLRKGRNVGGCKNKGKGFSYGKGVGKGKGRVK